MQATRPFPLRRSLVVVVVSVSLLGTASPALSEKDSQPPRGSGNPSAVDFSTPIKTFQTYLHAIKANDLATAKRCWFISDNNESGVLDIIAGRWIAFHRFNELARSKFTAEGRALLKDEGLTNDHLTDDVIDRALERLKNAEVKISGNTAKLRTSWPGEDGFASEPPAFLYEGGRPGAKFRRVNDGWKMDAHREIGFQRPAEFFEPHSWFYFYPGYVAVVNQLLADIESGKLRTAALVLKEYQAKTAALVAKAEEAKKAKPLGLMDARFFAAWLVSLRYTREFDAGRGSLWGVYHWSQRLMEAEMARCATEAERTAAAAAHVERLEEAQSKIRWRAAMGRCNEQPYLAADAYRADAEVQLAKRTSGPTAAAVLKEAATARLAAARLTYSTVWNDLERVHNSVTPPNEFRRLPFGGAAYWSHRVLTAELAVLTKKAHRLAAIREYRDRSERLEKAAWEEFKAGNLSRESVSEATFHVANAKVLLMELERGKGEEKSTLPGVPKVRIEAAQAAYDQIWAGFSNRVLGEAVYEWSNRWREAAMWAAQTKAEKVAAAQAHLDRMRKLQKPLKEWDKKREVSSYEAWATDFYVAEAELLLSAVKAD
jgi:hypothetical protein